MAIPPADRGIDHFSISFCRGGTDFIAKLCELQERSSACFELAAASRPISSGSHEKSKSFEDYDHQNAIFFLHRPKPSAIFKNPD
jgi:hypothetical protein